MLERLAAALLALTLGACAAAPPRSAPPAPPLAGPAAFKQARTASQVVRGAYGEREMTMQCAVQIADGTVSVVGIGSLGQRLFTVVYDGLHLKADASTFVPGGFAPERVLADLELALWPLPALQAAYAGTAWSVSEPFAGARRLRRDGKLVAEVHYAGADPWTSRYWVANLENGYTVAVEPQPQEP